MMSIATLATADEDMRTVTEAVLAGRPIPPDVLQRVDERSADFRSRMMAAHGLQNTGVSIIRQARENCH